MNAQLQDEAGFTVTRNPVTGEVLARVPLLSAEDLRAIIRRAREAQPAWAARPLAERRRYMAAMRRVLLERTDELAQCIADCVGKPRVDALATEVMTALLGAKWYEGHARNCLKPRRLPVGSLLFFNKRSTVHRLPLGVVGIIAPWNYPLGIPMHEIVPALLAGNAVVFKTAPETLPVGQKIAALFAAAGLPAGVFQHVNVDGALCGDVFLETGGVDKLFFTGSVRVGKLLMEKAARTLTPLSLELGGKDAMIVCADADLERAAGGAIWAGMSNAGQSCAGVERLYVHRDVYEPFMKLLREKVQQLRVGRDVDYNQDIGALCTDRQVNTVKEHLEEALRQGAQVFAQAAVPAGGSHFIAPTVLTNVNHNMRVMREETFGPVLGVMRVDSDAEALRLANDSPYGLSGSIWTRDLAKGRKLALQLHAGAVTVNDHLLSHGLTETPWGGYKDSGIGRGHGAFAFDEVTAPQVVVEDWLKLARRNVFWQPYSADIYQGLKGIMTALHGRGIAARLQGLLRFSRIMPRMFPARESVRRAAAESGVAEADPRAGDREHLKQLERYAEEAYTRMYDSRSPSGDYSEAKDSFHAAISLAQELGLKDEVARLEKRLQHVKSVFRSQFS
jgi:acyl-CoA reductase-like NAD-dependent aldehyde dehydrogenase